MRAIAAIMLMITTVFTAGCNSEEDCDSKVKVTTSIPQDITQTSAVCGGVVTATQGTTFAELGVCWSRSANPTAGDSHLSTTNWEEPYVCTITGLEPGITYHVRAYALHESKYHYGKDESFTTEEDSGSSFNGHDYVDLGLPSGTLWATCNVGADTPEGNGYYFAWAETQTKVHYNWASYQYCNGVQYTLTKYCNNSEFGYYGFTDNLTVLLPEDDAATANWGSGWRMPTSAEWQELFQNTTNTWTTLNDVNGMSFTASNGNKLFLPAAGAGGGYSAGSNGCYWSSSLHIGFPDFAWFLQIIGSNCYIDMDVTSRASGHSVRPVREK